LKLADKTVGWLTLGETASFFSPWLIGSTLTMWTTPTANAINKKGPLAGASCGTLRFDYFGVLSRKPFRAFVARVNKTLRSESLTLCPLACSANFRASSRFSIILL
jgi:hypothetical protein